MTNLNTSPERVDATLRLSERLYEVLDRPIDGPPRSHTILELGVKTVSALLLEGASLDEAGMGLLSAVQRQLELGGLPIDDPAYDEWPEYQSYIAGLPTIKPSNMHGLEGLDPFIHSYATTRRSTIDNTHKREDNAHHAVHLIGWGVPYQMRHYPALSPNASAVYDLFHDGIEAITGDVQTLNLPVHARDKKDAAERNALPQLKALLGRKFIQTYKIMESYEHLTEPEMRSTKTRDKLEPAFTHLNTKGLAFWSLLDVYSEDHYLSLIQDSVDRMYPYAKDFPLLLEDHAELTRRVAKASDWPKRVAATSVPQPQ